MKKTAKVTYDVIRRMAIQLPNVEEGTSYGTPALKVKKKLFVRLREEGDAIVTPEGQEFARGDIQTRKKIFRATALAHVPLLRQMEQSLKAKSDRTLPDEFFRDLLDEHFSEDEARRQLETAIQWGRYAEIFDYDAATGKLTLTEA